MRSTILPLSLLLLAPAAPPQTQVNLGRQSKNVDFSQAPFTRPVQTGGNLPATCTVGDLYFHTGMEAGKNLFGCTSTNTWLGLGLGGGAVALATQEEAENGIENTHYMSPLRSAQAIVEQCALPAQSGHPGKFLKTDGSAATWTAHLTLSPSAVQTIDAATGSITADALNVRIDPNSNYALTSTPTIADGLDGQLLLISNNSASYSVTLQDESFLANSNLRLGGSNVTIVPRGSLLLAYNTALASWVRADTVGGGGGGGGITSLNSQTGTAQTFVTGASGTNFSIASAGDTHTFNLPEAGASARGVVSTTAQTFAGKKTFSPTSASAGLNAGSATSDPSSPADGDTYYNSSTHKFRCYQNGAWTDCISSAGAGIRTDYLSFPAANCQMGAATTGFALPSSNYPSAQCVSGTNTTYGTLAFAENGAGAAQPVQYHFPLPPDWTGAIDVDARWRTTATSGAVVWQIQTACVADGETGDPAWNAVQKFTADTAKATALQWNDVTPLTGLAVPGCAAGEELLFKFFRDATDAGDTLAATAELIWLRFTVRRTQ